MSNYEVTCNIFLNITTIWCLRFHGGAIVRQKKRSFRMYAVMSCVYNLSSWIWNSPGGFFFRGKHSRMNNGMSESSISFCAWTSSGLLEGAIPPFSCSHGNRPHSHCNKLYPNVSISPLLEWAARTRIHRFLNVRFESQAVSSMHVANRIRSVEQLRFLHQSHHPVIAVVL